MFTGIVEQTGLVERLEKLKTGARLTVFAPELALRVKPGESVAVNGCCLTSTLQDPQRLRFDLLHETLERTNLGALKEGSSVNLEQAMVATARLGGHFVQGHVDCTAPILSLERVGDDHRLEIELPQTFAKYMVLKGSVAVDGISLTVAELKAASFVIWLIPHTMARTVLRERLAGDRVNLEFDMLAKYVERLISARS